jgi:transposase InsO family protein
VRWRLNRWPSNTSVDLFRAESILLKSYWVLVVMDIFTRRIIGFGVATANPDGVDICVMFNRAVARHSPNCGRVWTTSSLATAACSS